MLRQFPTDTPAPDARGYWHYTYVVTDRETGEWCAGAHSTRRLRDGYRGSADWIKQHPDHRRLTLKVVAFHHSKRAAFIGEAQLVTDSDVASDPLCRNLRGGGPGMTPLQAKDIANRPHVREKHRQRMIELNDDADFTVKRVTALRLALSDPTVSAKKSKSMLRAYDDPEKAARIYAGIARTNSNPEHIAKRAAGRSVSMRARWSDPQFRARMIFAFKHRKSHQAKPDSL